MGPRSFVGRSPHLRIQQPTATGGGREGGGYSNDCSSRNRVVHLNRVPPDFGKSLAKASGLGNLTMFTKTPFCQLNKLELLT